MGVFSQKIKHVREHVSMEKLLNYYGVYLRPDQLKSYGTSQISCPMHGLDTHKSAKFYEDSNSIYCWACGKQFSVIDLVMEKENLSVGNAIAFLMHYVDEPFVEVPEDSVLHGSTDKQPEQSFDYRLSLLDQKCRRAFSRGYPLHDVIRLFELVDVVNLSRDDTQLQRLEGVINEL